VAGHRAWGTTPDQLKEWQRHQAIDHWTQIQNDLPFFREWLKGLVQAELLNGRTTHKGIAMSSLPGSTRVRAAAEDIWTFAKAAEASRDFSALFKDQWIVGLSSGTTGQPSLFLTTPQEHSFYLGTLFSKVPQLRPGRSQKIAFVLRAFSKLYEPSALSRLDLRFFDLYAPAEQWIQELNSWEPDVVIAPASVLLYLAAEESLWRKNLRAVISVAEVLEPEKHSHLQRVLGVDVGEVYQAMEGFLGHRCSEGEFHLNEDLIRFEYQTIQSNVARLLVTDLYRNIQPLYRYELGDLVRLKGGSCSCGQPTQRIHEVLGRQGDVYYGPTGPIFPDQVYRLMSVQFEGLEDFSWKWTIDSKGRLTKIDILVTSTLKDFSRVSESLKVLLKEWGLPDGIPLHVKGAFHRQPGPTKQRRVQVHPET